MTHPKVICPQSWLCTKHLPSVEGDCPSTHKTGGPTNWRNHSSLQRQCLKEIVVVEFLTKPWSSYTGNKNAAKAVECYDLGSPITLGWTTELFLLQSIRSRHLFTCWSANLIISRLSFKKALIVSWPTIYKIVIEVGLFETSPLWIR